MWHHSRARAWPVLLLCVASCSRIMGPQHDPIPAYPDGLAGITAFANDTLAAAQKDQRERVHDLVASLKMRRDELDDLFGPKAADLAPVYEEMMGSFINRGALDLCAIVYERKYDAVEVIQEDLDHPPIGPQVPDSPVTAYAALARSLVHRPTIYSLRFYKKGGTQSTRYGFFFFHDGKWRTGNQLGHIIDKRQRELTEAKPAH